MQNSETDICFAKNSEPHIEGRIIVSEQKTFGLKVAVEEPC